MKEQDNQQNEEIKKNVKWFSKFSLEKRFEIAYNDMKAIKILRSLKPKKDAKSG